MEAGRQKRRKKKSVAQLKDYRDVFLFSSSSLHLLLNMSGLNHNRGNQIIFSMARLGSSSSTSSMAAVVVVSFSFLGRFKK